MVTARQCTTFVVFDVPPRIEMVSVIRQGLQALVAVLAAFPDVANQHS